MRLAFLPACFALAVLLPAAVQAQDTPAAEGEDEELLEQHADTTETPPPAEDEPEELPAIYSAVGLQKIGTDFENVDDAVNLDVTLVGFRIPTVSWFAVELNLSGTVIPGQVRESSTTGPSECPLLDPFCTPTPGSSTTSETDFALTTAGVFAVLRSPGKFYGVGKVGYRYLSTTLPEYEDDRSGNALSLGAGYRWKDDGTYAELGYTRIADGIDAIGFSVSYSYDRDW